MVVISISAMFALVRFRLVLCAHTSLHFIRPSLSKAGIFSHIILVVLLSVDAFSCCGKTSLHPAVFVIWILAYIYFSTNVIMLLNFVFKEFYVVEKKKKKIMLLDSEPHILGQGEGFVHVTVFAALS